MKILHLAHDSLAQQVAGVEVYTSRLLSGQQGLDDPGLVVARVDADRRSGEYHKSTWQDVPCYEVIQNRDSWRFEQTWRDARLSPAFRAIFSDFRPDLIHVQSLLRLTLAAIDVAFAAQIPVVLTLHDHGFACAQGGQRFHVDRTRCDRLDARRCARCTWASVGPIPALRAAARNPFGAEQQILDSNGRVPSSAVKHFRTPLQRVLARRIPVPFGPERIRRRWDAMRSLSDRVACFLAPSRDMQRAATEFGLPADRVCYLPHGVPGLRPSRPRLFDNLARRFGYVGSIVPHKGVHHLIEAFSTMPAHAILDIYGSLRDSPDYVRDLRARCHHPGIHFAGELRPEEVPAAMASFDCLIAPSIWQENAPLGVQEAFAAGTPVVASDLGGHRELFEEGGGLLIPPGDHSALSTVLTRLATEPGLIGQIASGVRPPRTMEQHLAELRSLYSAVLERVDHPVRSSTP